MKLLYIKWNEKESVTYYIDKDEYSAVHETNTAYLLNSFSGTYRFDKRTKNVKLYDGVRTRNIDVKNWSIIETE